MKKLTVVYIIIMGILIVSLTFVGAKISSKNKPYKDYESDIVESLKIYCGQDTNLKKLPKKGETLKVSLDELRDFGVKLKIQNTSDTCDGYGIVKGNGLSYSYEAYIKCKNYTTEGFTK